MLEFVLAVQSKVINQVESALPSARDNHHMAEALDLRTVLGGYPSGGQKSISAPHHVQVLMLQVPADPLSVMMLGSLKPP